MWSSYDGRFKLLDFGLTFHTDEEELHQIQSPGYKAPEAAEWNKYKDDLKKKRKRKLQGTYSDLTKVAPAYDKGLQKVGALSSSGAATPSSSVGASTPTTESPIPAGASRTILRAPPRRHRLSGVFSGSSDRESIIVLDEYQRHSRRGSNTSVTSANDSKAVAAAAAAVTAACNKWLSESSGIFTESTKTASSTNSVLPPVTSTTTTATGSSSVTTSTILSSETSSINVYDDEEGQEWRRGRTRGRSKSKQEKQPRPTSVCAALIQREMPFIPNAAIDM